MGRVTTLEASSARMTSKIALRADYFCGGEP